MDQFKSLEQAASFVVGRLEGLAGSTRYSPSEMSPGVRKEMKEIAEILNTQLNIAKNDIPNY